MRNCSLVANHHPPCTADITPHLQTFRMPCTRLGFFGRLYFVSSGQLYLSLSLLVLFCVRKEYTSEKKFIIIISWFYFPIFLQVKQEMRLEGKSILQYRCAALVREITEMVVQTDNEEYLNQLEEQLRHIYNAVRNTVPVPEVQFG